MYFLRNILSTEDFSWTTIRQLYHTSHLLFTMPSKPTKSILKQSKGGAGPSRSIQAGPSSTNRNTKINAGSKLQKKLNVERGAVPSSSRPTKASRPAPVQEEESEDDNDFGDEDGDLDMEEGDSGLDTDEEIARGTTKDGSSKKASSACP